MANSFYRGGATPVKQLLTAEITAVDGTPADNTFIITLAGITVSVVGDTDEGTTATNLIAALQAETQVFYKNVVWANVVGVITATAANAGVPVDDDLTKLTLTVTGVGAGTVDDFTETTANAGPNDLRTAANYESGVIPGAGDTLVVKDTDQSILWGLKLFAAIDLQLIVHKSFLGKIGLRWSGFLTSVADGRTEAFATGDIPDYRATHLELLTAAAGRIELGLNETGKQQAGSNRIQIDTGTNAVIVLIHDTNAAADREFAVDLRSDDVATDVFIRKAPGGVGIDAAVPNQASTIRKVHVADETAAAKVTIGAGVTLTTFYAKGGTTHVNAAATLAGYEVHGGTHTIEGDFTITLLENFGATVFDNHIKSGGGVSVTTADLYDGTTDLLQSTEARLYTNLNFKRPAAIFKADPDNVTITNFNPPVDEPYQASFSAP